MGRLRQRHNLIPGIEESFCPVYRASCSEARYCTKSSFMLYKEHLCKTSLSFRSKCPKTCGLCPAAAGDAATAATGQKPQCKCLPKQESGDHEYCATSKSATSAVEFKTECETNKKDKCKWVCRER